MRISRQAAELPEVPFILGPSFHRPGNSAATNPDISVVMPCLNEEESVASSVREALEGIRSSGLIGEVIVVDNGSVDGSVKRARAAGARVVREHRRGYGNACRRGLQEARGEVVVLGDSDGTYDFRDIPRFVDAMIPGVGVVIGNRLHRGMESGAMPWLHRYVGNPGLTAILNVLFATNVSDSHCGLRAISRPALDQLNLQSPGMEFASEFLIEAASHGVRISQIQTTYRRRLGGVPKLRTFRDGWRHLGLLVARRFTPGGKTPHIEPQPSFTRV